MAIDAATCIASGECVVLTKTILQTLYGFSILAGLFLLIILMIGFFTPAMIFLKAKFKKGTLIYLVNRGQQGKFVIANNKYQGIADVKGIGPHIITENSHTVESKSKMPFYFSFGEFATTLPLEYASIIQFLRDSGEKISNIDDLADMIGLKFNGTLGKWEKVKFEKLTDKQKDNLDKFKAQVAPYKTIRIHDLAYMFPFNITPALVESRTQHMIGLKMNMFNKMNMQYVLMFIMILMGTVLAAVIAFKFLKSGDATGANALVQTATATIPGGLSA